MLGFSNESHSLKNTVLWTAAAGLLLGLLLLVAACAVNPVTGEQQLALMSENQELQLGKQNYPQTTQASGGEVPNDPELLAYVNQVGKRLAQNSHRPNLPWEFNVVNEGSINAFALPGGKISITRGLITKMENEDELAAVLGHEVGHVTARHSVSQYSRGVLLSTGLAGLGVALSGSEYAGLGATAAGVAGGLYMLSYSRDQERQADDLGYRYMTANGYNPRGMVQLFEIFLREERNQKSSVSAFLSSHPLTDERIAKARQLVDQTSPSLVNQPFQTARFQQVLARQKQRAPAYEAQERGGQLMSQKQYRQAAQFYQQAIELYHDDGLFHSDLAVAYYLLNQPSRAAETAAMGARLSPQVFKPNYLAGVINLKEKQYDQAARFLGAAQRILPQNGQTSYFLANAYEGMGQRNQAARIYQNLYQVNPQGEVGQASLQRLRSLGY